MILAFFLIVLTALFFPGLIAKTKAIAAGRKGQGLFQHLIDIVRLLRKGNVYSEASSYIFQWAVPVYFASILLAMLMLPFAGVSGLFGFEGDVVFFSYVLALGKFLMILAALDTASGFEGMGANREALYSMLVEPVFFLVVGSLALFTGHTSFLAIFEHIQYDNQFALMIVLLAGYLLLKIAMVENSRLPVDDPRTHLELTMVHEVMVLDHSGFDLALIQLGNALKFGLYGTLIANLIIPPDWSLAPSILSYFGVQIGFAVLVGLLESFRARNKMGSNPQYLLTQIGIAFMLFFAVMIIKNNI